MCGTIFAIWTTLSAFRRALRLSALLPVIQIRGSISSRLAIALAIAAWTLFCSICLAQSSGADNEEVSSKLDAYMTAMTDSGFFMGAVLVAQDRKVLLSHGYGMANLEHDVPNTAQTRFDIASVNKTFTAALVLLLAERGKLSVQDPICKYLSDGPPAWKEVTIYHLLTHTSGIM